MESRDTAIRESKALRILLAIDDPPLKQKQLPTESNKTAKGLFPPLTGKQNLFPRRGNLLPLIKTSKDQLKLILRRLEEEEHEEEVNMKEKSPTFRKLVEVNMGTQSRTAKLKSVRQLHKIDHLSGSAGKESRNILKISRGEDARILMRQNNYSTNALNLKTLTRLQQINSGSKAGYKGCCPMFGGRIVENPEGKGVRRVGFLRKGA